MNVASSPHCNDPRCMTCYMRRWRNDLKKRLPNQNQKVKNYARDHTVWWRLKQRFGDVYNLQFSYQIFLSREHVKAIREMESACTITHFLIIKLFDSKGDILGGNKWAYTTADFLLLEKHLCEDGYLCIPYPIVICFAHRQRKNGLFNLYCIFVGGFKIPEQENGTISCSLEEFVSSEEGKADIQFFTELAAVRLSFLEELQHIVNKYKLTIAFNKRTKLPHTKTRIQIETTLQSPLYEHIKLGLYWIEDN